MPDEEFVFAVELPLPGIPISHREAKRLRYERRVASYLINGKIAFKRSELRTHFEAQRTEALPDNRHLLDRVG